MKNAKTGSLKAGELNNKKDQPRSHRARQRKTWKEMSLMQRSANIVMVTIEFILTGWALWDIGHRPADQINGQKRAWFIASFIQPFGPATYLIFGRKRSAALATRV